MSDDEFYYLEQRRKRELEAQKYDGMDKDFDKINDSYEISAGIHSETNKPQHNVNVMRRLGPSTKGLAFVGRSSNGASGIIFPWAHDIIKISPERSGTTTNGVHTMKTPKKMQLEVNFGSRHDHVSGNKPFSVDFKAVAPHKHKINDAKIKDLKIHNVLKNLNDAGNKHHAKMESFAKKYSAEHGLKKEAGKDHETINKLNQKLTGYMVKKKGNVSLIGGKNLDFSVVGIIHNPATTPKKRKGLLL